MAVGIIIGLLLGLVLGYLELSFLKIFLNFKKLNEVAVISGRQNRRNGRVYGYRVVKEGSYMPIPIVETTEIMDLSLNLLKLSIENAYSKGGIPLSLDLVALYSISEDTKLIENAIERFSGRNKEEINRVAKEVIEGVVRKYVSENEFERESHEHGLKIMESCQDDFDTVGLAMESVIVTKMKPEV